MMGIYKDNSTTRGNRKPWIADVTMKHPDGRELRRKKRARTQTEAKDFERALETQLKNELYNPERIEKPKAPKLKDFVPDFLSWYATVKKVSTVSGREGHIKKYVLAFFGEKRLNEITTAGCAAFLTWLRGQGLTAGPSLNSVLSALNVILKRAKTLAFISSLPEIELCAVPKKEAPILTEEDFRAALAASPSPQWKAAIMLSGICGLRRGEMAALRWEDISFERKLIHVKRNLWEGHEGTPKNGEARYVPMTEEVIETLKAMPNKKGPVCKGVLIRQINKIFKEHDIQGKGWHILRHTALTRLGNTGTPLHTLAKIAGHKQLSATQIYLHTQHEDLRAAAERLNSYVPPSGPQRAVNDNELLESGQTERTHKKLNSSLDAQKNADQQTTSQEHLSPAQVALSSLVASFGASFPHVSPSRGPIASPGIYTGEALSYTFLELAELQGLEVSL